MSEASKQPPPGRLRKRLVIVGLFAIAIGFFVASFLVRH